MATSTPAKPTAPPGAVDRYFKITERGSTVGAEVRGGLVTFFAMSYIIVLNPLIIGTVPDGTGQFLGGGTEARTWGWSPRRRRSSPGVMTILMGVVANFPLALAGRASGLNAVVAFSIAALPDVTWADAMGLVVLEGLIILLLVLTGFREAVFRAVPVQLKTAISVGIGLFIALIGLVDAGFVTPGAGTPLQLGAGGSLAGWPIVVFVVGLLLMIVLLTRGVRGAILISIVAATLLAVALEAVVGIGGRSEDNPNGWSLDVPAIPRQPGRDARLLAARASSRCSARSRRSALVAVVLLVFSIMLADFFDTMGTMVAIGGEANLLDEKRQPAPHPPDPRRRLPGRGGRGRGQRLVQHELHRVGDRRRRRRPHRAWRPSSPGSRSCWPRSCRRWSRWSRTRPRRRRSSSSGSS